jgi:hypothetical protein
VSSALAVGAVSAVLRNLLDNGLIEAGAALGSTVSVSAVAPDTIDLDDAEAPPRLNLFLHQATPNPGWRNAALPSRGSSGERLTNAPLALDLHYVLTAYARGDFQAEVLLGYAMHLLHERPVLDRAAIRRALDPSPLDVSMLPPVYQALAASDLADQVEAIKITPAVMSADEMSKLWSAIQTHYRPSVGYLVSVVLIEGRQAGRSPLPVLSRGGPIDPATGRDPGVRVHANLLPPLPTLFAAAPPAQQLAARLGEAITVSGVHLAGTGVRALLTHRLVTTPIEFAVTPNASGTSFAFTLPNDAAAQVNLPAGLWRLVVRLTPTGETTERETNAIGLQIAPAVVLAADAGLGLPAPVLTRGGTPPRVSVRLAARPQVRLAQEARLIIGTQEAVARPRNAASDVLEFDFPNSLPAGAQRVRLRVDGVDSVLVLRSGPSAPSFDTTQVLTVPA